MQANDFATTLIEMTEAYKAKPELERRISDLSSENSTCYSTIEILRAQIDALKAEIVTKDTTISEVKKERDDACFRNLELEELKDKVGGLVGQALGLFKASAPEPTPVVTEEPVAEPTPEPKVILGVEETEIPVQPSLSPTKPDGWENGKPYSYKPWYMNDEEWVSRGGHGKPSDTPQPEPLWF